MRTTVCAALLLLTLGPAPGAWAHAFPDNSSPHVGATVSPSPKLVQIWFDGEIEPVFSTLIVKNAAGAQVSQGNGQVSSSDNTLLETTLPVPLPPGQYWVYWSVIARDGHHTAGRFPFTIQ
ncbi:MAG TPA: copper resistance protein CopC [Gammaproteobacteria bacterium]|nr:copper resistance protein CopC [Gammaproteobacteria bacterium]